MKVVLTADVKDIGKKGDEKEVKPGFARNFLLPRDLAVSAESAEGKKIIAETDVLKEKKESESKTAQDALAGHQNLKITFKKKASNKKLFAGIKPAEIISSIEKAVGLRPTKIEPSAAIKEIGSHNIVAEFAAGQKLGVVVIAEADLSRRSEAKAEKKLSNN